MPPDFFTKVSGLRAERDGPVVAHACIRSLHRSVVRGIRVRSMKSGRSSTIRHSRDALSKQLDRVESDVAELRSMLSGFDPALLPEKISAEWISIVLRARRRREALFGAGIFADPGWDLLLHLYARELSGKRSTIGVLCDAAAVPRTTGLRWIGELEHAGLINRLADSSDRRRAMVKLSRRGSQAMAEYFGKPEAAILVI